MVEEVTREALVAKRHKASIGLIFGEADHLLGVEDGHQAVVAALSAWTDGACNIGLTLNRGVRWSPCLRRVPISGLIISA